MKNSSDFERGAAPELKSVEFLLWIIVLIEIISLLCEIARDNWFSYWRRDPGGSGSHKVPYVLVNSAASSGYISITIGFQTKNSSDLDVGRRPELKSDEFFVWNPIVIEIISLLFEIVGRSSCTLWEPDPAWPALRSSLAACCADERASATGFSDHENTPRCLRMSFA